MRFSHVAGLLLVGGIAVAFALNLTQTQCVCDNEWECTCPNEGEVLHDVTEEQLISIPEPEQSEYRHFLEAWESEYQSRNANWAERYDVFHSQDHTEEENEQFDQLLRKERRDFVLVFRDRDTLFRQRMGIQ